jgi:hypothetical protein
MLVAALIRPGAAGRHRREPDFRRAVGTPNRKNSEGIENVTLRGNEA